MSLQRVAIGILVAWTAWASLARVERAAAADRYARPGYRGKAKADPDPDIQVTPPDEATLGDDHQKNLAALEQERQEVLKHRLDILKKALAGGHLSLHQTEQVTLEELQAELELQDRPHLRIAILKKILEIRKKQEEEAKDKATSISGHGSEVNNLVPAHGRYIDARLRRIHAQEALEKEQIAQQEAEKEPAKPAEK